MAGTGKAFSVSINILDDIELDERVTKQTTPPFQYDLLDPFQRHKDNPPSPIPAEETLIACSYVSELNSAGSCEFKIAPTHPLYAAIHPIITQVTISEIDNMVWFGRVLSIELDWDMVKTVTCEGLLVELNSVPIFVDLSEDLFNAIPEVPFLQKYIPGLIVNPYQGFDGNWYSSIEELKDFYTDPIGKTPLDLLYEFQEETGGFFYYRFFGLQVQLVYYTPATFDENSDSTSKVETISQPIKLGENILDFSYRIEGDEIVSGIYPTGATVEVSRQRKDSNGKFLFMNEDGEIYYPPSENTEVERPEAYDIPVLDLSEEPLNLLMVPDETVEPDEDGIAPLRFTPFKSSKDDAPSGISEANSPNININTANNTAIIDIPHDINEGTLSAIVRNVPFEDAWSVEELREKAEAFIAKYADVLNHGERTIIINSIDLRFLDSGLQSLYIGRYANVEDDAHGISGKYLITKTETDVKTAKKRVTLGYPPNNTLTDIINRENRKARKANNLRKLKSKKEITAKTSDILFIPE